MPLPKIILSIYGLFLLSGAYFGLKAGSKISLVMGIVSGLLVFAGIYFSQTDPRCAYLFLTVLTGALSAIFSIRLVKTKKLMPSGMLLLMTLIALLVSILQFIKYKG